MNYNIICDREGYRRENLTEQDQKIMSWIDYIIDDFDNVENNIDLDCDAETVLGKMKKEIAHEVLSHVKQWLETTRLDIQITLEENME